MRFVPILSMCPWFGIGCFLLFGTPLGAILAAGAGLYFAAGIVIAIGTWIIAAFKHK